MLFASALSNTKTWNQAPRDPKTQQSCKRCALSYKLIIIWVNYERKKKGAFLWNTVYKRSSLCHNLYQKRLTQQQSLSSIQEPPKDANTQKQLSEITNFVSTDVGKISIIIACKCLSSTPDRSNKLHTFNRLQPLCVKSLIFQQPLLPPLEWFLLDADMSNDL